MGSQRRKGVCANEHTTLSTVCAKRNKLSHPDDTIVQQFDVAAFEAVLR